MAFELGPKVRVSAPREGRVGAGMAFLAESVTPEEMWEQENQACLKEKQVVVTGWSVG